MNDFDKRFKKRSDEFDRHLNRIRILSTIGAIFSTLLTLGIIGFVAWVIITIMRFIGAV
jgi:hypothetical protein